jgi:hypothetical protein
LWHDVHTPPFASAVLKSVSSAVVADGCTVAFARRFLARVPLAFRSGRKRSWSTWHCVHSFAPVVVGYVPITAPGCTAAIWCRCAAPELMLDTIEEWHVSHAAFPDDSPEASMMPFRWFVRST